MDRVFFESVRACLLLPGPAEKCAAVLSLDGAAREGRLAWDEPSRAGAIREPGRPERP